MTQHRYLLAYNLNYRVNIFVSVLHVRIHMEDIDIHPKIVLIDIVKNRIYCNELWTNENFIFNSEFW